MWTVFVAPRDNIAEDAGYVVWKDKNVVIFYSNDLAGTHSSPIIHGEDEEDTFCVRGVLPIIRLTGVELFHQTTFLVAAIIVAYNMFMNSVDRMDQIWAGVCTRRKE